MRRLYTPGFVLMELLIVVVIIGSICFLGYTFYQKQEYAQNRDDSTSESTAEVATAPEITSTDELASAEKTLDSITVGSESDDARLDAELATF